MAAPPDQAAALLADLPRLAFGFVLLLARAGCACMLVPVLGEAEVPAMVRAGFVVALTFLLLPGFAASLPPAPSGPLLAASMVLAEVVTGLWLGWLARMIVLALPLAGQIAALATGLSSVLQPDPALGAQSAALGRLMGVAAPVLLLGSGLHALPIAAIAGSYAVIPAGALLPATTSLPGVVAALGEMLALALRLAAPFLLASLAWNAVIAVLGRMVPGLPLVNVSGSAQVLGGLLLLGVLAGAMTAVWQERASVLLAALPGF